MYRLSVTGLTRACELELLRRWGLGRQHVQFIREAARHMAGNIAHGCSWIRSAHAGECYNAALSVVKDKIILNSSAGRGWYASTRPRRDPQRRRVKVVPWKMRFTLDAEKLPAAAGVSYAEISGGSQIRGVTVGALLVGYRAKRYH